MKKILSLLVSPLIALLLLGAVMPTRTDAAEFFFKKGYVLEQGESVNENLYIFTDNVDIKGNVRSDTYIFAQNIKIEGTITGNLYLFSNTIELGKGARILGDIYAFGYKIELDGETAGKTIAFGYSNKHSGKTAKDVISFSAHSIVSGEVGDDLTIFSTKSVINADINGEALIFSEDYTIEKDRVGKNIYDQKSVDKIAESQGFHDDKEIKKLTPQQKILKSIRNTIISSTAFLLAGAFLIFLTPVKTGAIVKNIANTPNDFLKSFALGIGVFLLAGIPITILFITVLGIPVALILVAFIIFVTIFGKLWVEVAIGSEILKLFKVKGYRPFKSLLVGRCLSTIISFIPVIYGVYTIILTCTAMGAFIRIKRDAFKVENMTVKRLKLGKK